MYPRAIASPTSSVSDFSLPPPRFPLLSPVSPPSSCNSSASSLPTSIRITLSNPSDSLYTYPITATPLFHSAAHTYYRRLVRPRFSKLHTLQIPGAVPGVLEAELVAHVISMNLLHRMCTSLRAVFGPADDNMGVEQAVTELRKTLFPVLDESQQPNRPGHVKHLLYAYFPGLRDEHTDPGFVAALKAALEDRARHITGPVALTLADYQLPGDVGKWKELRPRGQEAESWRWFTEMHWRGSAVSTRRFMKERCGKGDNWLQVQKPALKLAGREPEKVWRTKKGWVGVRRECCYTEMENVEELVRGLLWPWEVGGGVVVDELEGDGKKSKGRPEGLIQRVPGRT